LWSISTTGLLILEPVLYLATGAGTLPGTPFKVSYIPSCPAQGAHTPHTTHPSE
jgi:hypothetical protein